MCISEAVLDDVQVLAPLNILPTLLTQQAPHGDDLIDDGHQLVRVDTNNAAAFVTGDPLEGRPDLNVLELLADGPQPFNGHGGQDIL